MTDEATLTPAQVEEAIAYLLRRWPQHTMTAAQRDGWIDALVYMRHGELQVALGKVRSGGYRPDPEKVLDAVMATRPKRLPPNHVDAPKQDDPEPIDVDGWLDKRYGESAPTSGGDWLRECQRMVGRTRSE